LIAWFTALVVVVVVDVTVGWAVELKDIPGVIESTVVLLNCEFGWPIGNWLPWAVPAPLPLSILLKWL